MSAYSPQNLPDPAHRTYGTQVRVSLAGKTKLSQLAEAQRLFSQDMRDPTLTLKERLIATNAWKTLEEEIRILRGKTRPGTRNVLVKENADGGGSSGRRGERVRNRNPDYLMPTSQPPADAETDAN